MTQYVVPRLMDAGYEVRVHARIGHDSNVMQWSEPTTGKPMQIWPGGSGPYGEDLVPAHLDRLSHEAGKPSTYLFCGDTIALGHIPNLSRNRSIIAAAWTAVDWEWPTPKGVLDNFASWFSLFPMSHHGHRVLAQDGLTNLADPVWLGCNTQLWKPADRSEFPDAMRSMRYSEKGFNLFSCFANQYMRKGEFEMLQAVGEFDKRHPEAGVHLFMLTQAHRDWNMPALVDHLGMRDIVTISDAYAGHMGDISEEDVVRMMNCSDAVLSLGYEGFGLQTIEAQALNKPVVGFNAGATPELLKAGILTDSAKDRLEPNLLRRPLPDALEILRALEKVYELRGDKKRWNNGRPWIEKNLTWDHTARALIDRLETIEQRIADEEIIGPPAPGALAEANAKRSVVVER